jgi:endo-1,4-beta-xylanase
MNDPLAQLKVPRRGPVRLLLGTLALALVTAMAVLTPGTAHAAVCGVQTGTTNGMYWQMWNNGQGSACITVGSSGNSYSSTWSGIGDFVAGVGWNPGSSQTVSFSGSMSASGGTALASLYGWSTNPLVEYYVIQDDIGGSPALGTQVGTMTSDGATYKLFEHQQVNQPSIQGTATFNQYLAIRQGNATSGTITTQNFFNAWASHGMNLGTLNYQIFATESFGGGSGSSNFTVSHSSGGTGSNTVTVTNPGNKTGTVGTATSAQVSATDSGGAALTYSATGLPAGLSISSSGLISGTPTTAGTSNVTVTAKDSTGASGSTSFTWTISAPGGGGGGGGGGACHVTYTKSSEWAGGFTAQVVIQNTSATALSSWSLAFTFPGDQKITSNFNGGFSQAGANATLTNASYNGTIAPNGSVNVGFQGTWTSNDTNPTSFSLNGTACS